MYNSQNEENVVTCLYCIHHNFRYRSENVCYPKSDQGICLLKNIDRAGSNKICKDFKIKPGFYTPKWYPGKE